MLSQEEIRIKAGLDYSKVTAGLTDIRAQVFKLAKDVPAKLSGLMRASLFGVATTILTEILPTWDQIWSRVYGVDENSAKMLEQSRENLRGLRKAMQSARDAFENTVKSIAFKNAKPEQKMFTLGLDEKALAEEEARINRAIAKQKELIDFMKTNMPDTELKQPLVDEQVQNLKGFETNLFNVKTERAKKQQEIKEQGDRMIGERSLQQSPELKPAGRIGEKLSTSPTEPLNQIKPLGAKYAPGEQYREITGRSMDTWMDHTRKISSGRGMDGSGGGPGQKPKLQQPDEEPLRVKIVGVE